MMIVMSYDARARARSVTRGPGPGPPGPVPPGPGPGPNRKLLDIGPVAKNLGESKWDRIESPLSRTFLRGSRGRLGPNGVMLGGGVRGPDPATPQLGLRYYYFLHFKRICPLPLSPGVPQRGARPQAPGQGARAKEEKPTRPGPRPGATGARVREILGPWPGGPGEGRKNPGPRPRGPGEGTHPPNPIKYAQLDDSRGCGIPTRCATSVHLASVSGYLAPRAGGGRGPGIQIKQVVGEHSWHTAWGFTSLL